MGKGHLIDFEGGECSGKDTHTFRVAKRLIDLGFSVSSSVNKNLESFQEPGSTPKAELIRIILKNKFDTTYELSDAVKNDFDLIGAEQEFSSDELSDLAKSYLENAMKISGTPLKNEIIYFVLHGSLPKNSDVENIMKNLRGVDNASELFFKDYLTKEVLPSKAQEYLFFAARNILFENRIKPALDEFDFTIINRSRVSTQVYQGQVFNPSRVEIIREENIRATSGIFPDLILYFDIPVSEMDERQKSLKRGRPDFFDGQAKDFHERVRTGYFNELKYYKSLPCNHPHYNKMVRVSTLPSANVVEEIVLDLILSRLDV